MKLVTVLMLTALPLYCYAGIGCDILDNAMRMTVDPDVSVTEYMKDMQKFSPDEETEQDIIFMKECFLQQSKETVENLPKMKEAIDNSVSCAQY